MQEKKLWSQIALEESDEEITNQQNPIEPPQLLKTQSEAPHRNNYSNRKKQSKTKKPNQKRDLIGQIEQLLMSFTTDELQIRVKTFDYVDFNELAKFFENEFVDVRAIIRQQQQNSSLELIASPQAAIEILRNCGIKPRILGYNLSLQFPQEIDEPIHPSLRFKKSYSQPEPPKQQPVIKFQRGTQVETPIIQPVENSKSQGQQQDEEEVGQIELVKTQSEIIKPNIQQDQPKNQEKKYNNYRDRDRERRNFERNFNKPGYHNNKYQQNQRIQYVEKNQPNDQNDEDVCETPIQPNRDEEHQKYGLETPKKEKNQDISPLQPQEVQNQSGEEDENNPAENILEEQKQKKKKKKNKKKNIMLFNLLFLQTATCLFENNMLVKRISRLVDFQKVLESESVSMVYFYQESNCERCVQAGGLIDKIAEDQEDIIKVYAADCDELRKDDNTETQLPYCQHSMQDQLPQISFFEPPVSKVNPYTGRPMIAQEHRFQGEASPQSLGQFGQKFIPNFVFSIKSFEEYEKFEQSDPQHNKVILFTQKKQTPALLKALAQQFNQRLKFGEVQESKETKQIIDDFEIKEFPQLYVLEKTPEGGYSREVYEQDLVIRPMKKYLKGFAIREKIPFESEPQPQKERRRRKEKEPQQEEEKKQPEQILPFILTQDVLNKQLLRNDKPALVHVFKDAFHPAWEEAIKKYKSLFDYYVLNATSYEGLAKEIGIKTIPSIKFYQVGNAGKKKATRIQFDQSTNLEEINKDLQELIDDRSIAISEHTLQQTLSQTIHDNKNAVFLFYNTPGVGLTYRVLSQLEEYSDKFKFFSFRDAPEQILKQFQITSFPSIQLIFREVKNKQELEEDVKPEQVKSAYFTGKMNLDEIKVFLDAFDSDKKKSTKKLIEISNQEQLTEYCEKKQQVCFIALLNGEHKKQKYDDLLSRWESQLEIFDRIKNQHGTKAASFVYLDSTCHDELLVQFDISEDSLPNFVVYNSARKQYSKLIGRFEYDYINRFIETYSKGKASSNSIAHVDIHEKDCEEYQRKKQEQSSGLSDFDNEILKEILEEERIKKEQIDKDLKKDKKNKKKGKKSKDEL
ncbi:hypothetical protein pb186bvf_004045 [Paramecium bursaria]